MPRPSAQRAPHPRPLFPRPWRCGPSAASCMRPALLRCTHPRPFRSAVSYASLHAAELQIGVHSLRGSHAEEFPAGQRKAAALLRHSRHAALYPRSAPRTGAGNPVVVSGLRHHPGPKPVRETQQQQRQKEPFPPKGAPQFQFNVFFFRAELSFRATAHAARNESRRSSRSAPRTAAARPVGFSRFGFMV